MSKGQKNSIPHHTHREFLIKSDLEDILKSGQATQMGRSMYNPRSQSLHHDNTGKAPKEDVFAQTASKLSNVNFNHHNESCLCHECHCGRHQCKLKVVKPEFTKNSVYQRSYYGKQFIPN